MSSHIQLTQEAPASIPAAGGVDKLRIFLDSTDGQLKTKDSSNVVATVWGTALDDLAKTFPGASVPAEVIAGQTLVANEVLPVGAIAGAVNFDLPALAGVDAGQDLFAVIDAQGSATTYAITITPNGAETIDGVNAPITLSNNYGIRGLIKTSATNWTVIYGANSTLGSEEVVGAVNEDETVSGSERVIGGLVFNGSAVPAGKAVYLQWLGSATDPDTTSVAEVRLYDLGPAAGPEEAPAQRASVLIDTSTADEGKNLRKRTALNPTASPVGAGDIYNTDRLYQIRLFLSASAGSEAMKVLKVSLVIE